jgi:predicted transcriptional regulator
MAVLTIRVSDEEKMQLTQRAKKAGTTAGALVRQLIREKPFTTSADMLSEIDSLLGEKRFKIKARK